MARCLVVENNAGFLAWLHYELQERCGVTVIMTAASCLRARVLCASQPLDLILLDLFLLDGSALDLLPDIRRSPEHRYTPVILVTKFDPEGLARFNTPFTHNLARSIWEMDVAAMLVKPFSAAQLQAVVGKVLQPRAMAKFPPINRTLGHSQPPPGQ